MKFILSLFLYGLVAVPLSVTTWLIVYFGLEASFGMSVLYGTSVAAVVYSALIWRRKYKLLNRYQLTGKEYRYIKKNLREAEEKLKRLNRALFQVRSIHDMKQIGKLQQSVRKIYRIVYKEPNRFYLAERFFFYHLDSVVELSERYTFLKRQNVKDQEVRESLAGTEKTMKEIADAVEEDLMKVLSNDVDHLNLELDVAKHTMNSRKEGARS